MQVRVTLNKITPELLRKITDHAGEQITAYRWMRIDLAQVPAALSQALEDASKVPDSGVVDIELKNVHKPPSAPLVEPKKPLVLDEGGRRLHEHVLHNGLLPLDANAAAIRNWFASHPDVQWNATNVDRCVFRELEPYLLWKENNPGHLFWVTKLNPPPPKPAPPPPKPPKLGRLPNGENCLPLDATSADLAKASVDQVRDFLERSRKELV